jgi:hypothetical protein
MSANKFFRQPPKAESVVEPFVVEVSVDSEPNIASSVTEEKVILGSELQTEEKPSVFTESDTDSLHEMPQLSGRRKVLIASGVATVVLAIIASNIKDSEPSSINSIEVETTATTSETDSTEQLPVQSEIGFTDPDEITTTTSPTTTSTTILAVETPSTTELLVVEALPVENTVDPNSAETTSPSVVIDTYASLNCSETGAVIEPGWTISGLVDTLANRCPESGLTVSKLISYNPQISDFNKIISGNRINLVKPANSTSSGQNTIPSQNAPKIDCVAIGGVVKPLASGFTIEGYLRNLGYSKSDALFLAYSTSLASDYGLDGALIAGNNYCLPTKNGIAIRYGVKIG